MQCRRKQTPFARQLSSSLAKKAPASFSQSNLDELRWLMAEASKGFPKHPPSPGERTGQERYDGANQIPAARAGLR